MQSGRSKPHKPESPEQRERWLQCYQLTESPGWVLMFKLGFKPEIARIRQLLLYNINLSDAERKGMVLALTKLKEVFYKAYENTNVKIPQWLKQEFDVEEDGY